MGASSELTALPKSVILAMPSPVNSIFAGFISGLFKVVMPIIVGLFISIVIESVISRFVNKGYQRKWVVIITYICMILLLILSIVLVSPSIIKQVKVFLTTLPLLITNINNLLVQYHIDLTNLINLVRNKESAFEPGVVEKYCNLYNKMRKSK